MSPVSKKPPGSHSPVITNMDIQAIFSNIGVIHDHHVEFLKKIRKVVEDWNEEALIGDLFCSIVSSFLSVEILFTFF